MAARFSKIMTAGNVRVGEDYDGHWGSKRFSFKLVNNNRMGKTIFKNRDTDLHSEDERGWYPAPNRKHPSFAVIWKYVFDHFANWDKLFLTDHCFFSLEASPRTARLQLSLRDSRIPYLGKYKTRRLNSTINKVVSVVRLPEIRSLLCHLSYLWTCTCYLFAIFSSEKWD